MSASRCVKSIVARHGGQVWAESLVPGGGATFSFWFPGPPQRAGSTSAADAGVDDHCAPLDQGALQTKF